MIESGRQLSPSGDRKRHRFPRSWAENQQQSNHVKKQYYGRLSSQIDLTKKRSRAVTDSAAFLYLVYDRL
jgi:hypothetical protein